MQNTGAERERILVCVSASPTNADVIRRAAALSQSIGAELIALYVEDDLAHDEAQARAVHDHLSLAERHGAMLTTVYGNDPATAIAEYARVSGITKIVLGKSPGRRSLFAPKGTLMSRLNELAPDVEIIIVPNRLTEDNRRFSLKSLLQRERFSGPDLLRTALILALCTGVGFLFTGIGLAITNVVLIYILGVMGVALFTTGYVYSVLSSLLSVLVFNFFFTEPYWSLHSSPDYFATFAVMFAVALLSSSLTSRIKAQSILTANKAYQTEVLLSTSQLLQKAEDRTVILNVLQRQLSRLLEHSVLYYDMAEGGLAPEPVLYEIERDEGFAGVDIAREREVAAWVGQNAKHAGCGTRVYPQARCLYMAIRSEGKVWAVVGIRADNAPPIDEYRKNLMISILDAAHGGLQRDRPIRPRRRLEAVFKPADGHRRVARLHRRRRQDHHRRGAVSADAQRGAGRGRGERGAAQAVRRHRAARAGRGRTVHDGTAREHADNFPDRRRALLPGGHPVRGLERDGHGGRLGHRHAEPARRQPRRAAADDVPRPRRPADPRRRPRPTPERPSRRLQISGGADHDRVIPAILPAFSRRGAPPVKAPP